VSGNIARLSSKQKVNCSAKGLKTNSSKDRRSRNVRAGVDTGGTFTDFVFAVAGKLRIFKLPSTPDDPSRAITAGLRRIAAETGSSLIDVEVVHGTTVGTNALLQRRGARVALVTTAGFEDVIEIGRQARPELYNLNAVKPPALVASDLRFGVHERIAASGEVIEPLRESDLREIYQSIKQSGCESIAVSLLFSFANSKHEETIAQTLEALGLPLSISHQILPEYREYERASTVTVNAYLQPLMGRYLNRLSESVSGSNNQAFNLRVMQSSGGSISATSAAAEPVRTILSGPAGGVVGALRACKAAGFENIITFDMGGTSTDVALCDRDGMRLTSEAIVAGLPVAVPMMDIHTVGAGGGSIAYVDEGGSLRVGPESAGADPGPACYGRSLLPTVTDAHVVLGHFPGAGLLGGDFKLDAARAREALKQLAGELSSAAGRSVSIFDAAHGVLNVVNTNMERALRHVSVERGNDPRQFSLVPFGGAGGLHAVALARALRIPRIIVPPSPGALSAKGVLTADVVKDQSRTVMLAATRNVGPRLARVFSEIEKRARLDLLREGFAESKQRHERSLAVRYQGQSFELQIKQTSGNIAAACHRAHRARYGYARENDVVEIVSARVRSIGVVDRLKAARLKEVVAKGFTKPHDLIETFFNRKKVRGAVYRREEVAAGSRLRVPCVVTEYSATTVIPEGCKARIDSLGNMIIEVGNTGQ
jgi:N-methylhydantoinase A